MGESRVFQSKWPGSCQICGYSYDAGEDLHFVYFAQGKLVGHSTCHAAEWEEPAPREDRPRPCSLVTRGRRNHEKHCVTCGLEHAGEC